MRCYWTFILLVLLSHTVATVLHSHCRYCTSLTLSLLYFTELPSLVRASSGVPPLDSGHSISTIVSGIAVIH